MTSRRPIVAALLAALVPCAARAADWPTFRADAIRSAVTDERIDVPLAAAWTHAPDHPPAPAWPPPSPVNYAVMQKGLRQTLTLDAAYHVVADGKGAYYGSSAGDAIVCLDAATGARRWRYFVEGPVRTVPVLHKGLILAGSDDGWLYALEARTGALKWKYRAGPDGRRLPGNGRMISRWPVRGGPVADGDTVWLGAGLFPSLGVFLCALDATTGTERFKRPLDFTAQGTILAAADRLVVSSGRTSFRSCDRKDGRPLVRYGLSDPWKKNLVGGSIALAAEGFVATGPSEDGQLHWFPAAGKAPVRRTRAECAIVRDGILYLLTGGQLVARDLKAYLAKRDPRSRKDPPPIWSVSAEKATTLILTGGGGTPPLGATPAPATRGDLPRSPETTPKPVGRIVAAGDGTVAVHDAKDGKRLWSGKIDGRVEGLAFSGGRLFASLADGRTVCYAAGRAKSPARAAAASGSGKAVPENPALAQAAERALKAAGTGQGYALVLQAGTGRLAVEIAKRSTMRVVCRVEDGKKADALRAALASAGLYGTRIAIHAGGSEALPYPDAFANLVVSERALTAGAALPPAKEVLRVLRPYGGTVSLGVPAGKRAALEAWGRGLPAWRVDGSDPTHGTARRGVPPGAGEWTHFYADPANTACSGDTIRPGPMELAWFGRPGPTRMTGRHHKGQAPLFSGGRLFVPGLDVFTAVDAFNGTVLWEREIPRSVRIGALKDCGSMAAAGDRLLVAAGDACLVLDARTGETVRKIPAAGSGARAWGYLAAVDGLVVGSVARPGGSIRTMGEASKTIIWRNEQPVVCSHSLFAVKAESGSRAWAYRARGAIPNPTIAVGDGRVFFVESLDAATLKAKDGRVTLRGLVGKGARLVALDLKTGRVAWSKEADLKSLQHVIYLSYAEGMLLVSGSKYVEVDPAETKGRSKPKQLKRVRYDCFGHDARTGARRWAATGIPDYDEVLKGSHGEQVQHPAIVAGVAYGPGFAFALKTGKPHAGWAWRKSHKCATLSLSRHAAFSRHSGAKLPYVFDLKTGKGIPMTRVTRPGCWINTIPAGGMVLIPEASAGCTCAYPIQASMGLRPMSSR
jgi:outer membrane protein assembly factor BamB